MHVLDKWIVVLLQLRLHLWFLVFQAHFSFRFQVYWMVVHSCNTHKRHTQRASLACAGHVRLGTRTVSFDYFAGASSYIHNQSGLAFDIVAFEISSFG